MKDHVEIGHLTKYDAFRMNRDQVMDLEIWFKIHTNVSLRAGSLVVRVSWAKEPARRMGRGKVSLHASY